MKEKISDLQGEFKDSAHKIWLAGLGALTVAGEEGQKMFKTLVEKGEAFEAKEDAPVDKMKKTVDNAKGKVDDLWGKFESTINDRVAATLQKLGVPTREEIQQLTQRVDALMEAIDKVNEGKKSGK